MIHYVVINFDAILNPAHAPLLSLKILKEEYEKHNWTPRSSGMEIPPAIATKLERSWLDLPDIAKYYRPETDDEKLYLDGNPSRAFVKRYERNPHARKACIDEYGCSYAACGYDFEKTFGELEKGFIHVHHLEQLATIGKEHAIDPVRDLRPVCPNCHAMIHKRRQPYTIAEMQERLAFLSQYAHSHESMKT
ncbi:MAG: HNH endonuclease [Candidatus Hydrogenedentes bacterium]|nr:HNH endonuclease [Candidatus Hydrogenedentota bacterium]